MTSEAQRIVAGISALSWAVRNDDDVLFASHLIDHLEEIAGLYISIGRTDVANELIQATDYIDASRSKI